MLILPEFCASSRQTFSQWRAEVLVEDSVPAVLVSDLELVHHDGRSVPVEVLQVNQHLKIVTQLCYGSAPQPRTVLPEQAQRWST